MGSVKGEDSVKIIVRTWNHVDCNELPHAIGSYSARVDCRLDICQGSPEDDRHHPVLHGLISQELDIGGLHGGICSLDEPHKAQSLDHSKRRTFLRCHDSPYHRFRSSGPRKGLPVSAWMIPKEPAA